MRKIDCAHSDLPHPEGRLGKIHFEVDKHVLWRACLFANSFRVIPTPLDANEKVPEKNNNNGLFRNTPPFFFHTLFLTIFETAKRTSVY
jgi:hypothetical protein